MFRRTLIASLSVALLLSACGGETDTEPEADDTDQAEPEGENGEAFPATVTDDRGTEVTVDGQPERIVSLSPTHTEMLFAVGAGERVVAADDQSDHPEEAPTSELSGFEPNVEAILDEEPDLVVLSFDPGDVADSLEAVDVDVLMLLPAAELDDVFGQIGQIGEVTGHADDAAALNDDLQTEMDEIVAALDEPDEPLTYYHEVDENLFTATSDTFIGEVYGLLGLENIADDADEDGDGFPQLSPEAVIDADPDVVFLASADGGQTPEVVAERSGWDTITAVEQDNLYPVDSNLASRWGPRVVEFLRDAADAVEDTLERRG